MENFVNLTSQNRVESKQNKDSLWIMSSCHNPTLANILVRCLGSHYKQEGNYQRYWHEIYG